LFFRSEGKKRKKGLGRKTIKIMSKLEESFAHRIAQYLDGWTYIPDIEGRDCTELKHSCGAAIAIEWARSAGHNPFLVVTTEWRAASNREIDLRTYLYPSSPKTQFCFKSGIDVENPQKLAQSIKVRVLKQYLPMYESAVAKLEEKMDKQKVAAQTVQELIAQHPHVTSEVAGKTKTGFEFFRENQRVAWISGNLSHDAKGDLVGFFQAHDLTHSQIQKILEVLVGKPPQEVEGTVHVSVPEIHTGAYAVEGDVTPEQAIEAVKDRSAIANYLGSEYSRDLDSSTWEVSE